MRQYARTLPMEDPDLCCYLNKVQPMQQALEQAIKSGSAAFAATRPLFAQRRNFWNCRTNGLLKVNPLLNWTKEDVNRYIEEHNLPHHPLYEKGYRSIGCAPCTIAIGVNDDERAGRWAGRGKVECGLHTSMFSTKDISESQDEFRLDVTKDT